MKTIAWLIPRVTKGSGGHRTIIQHVNLLEDNGYKCDIYVKDDVDLSPDEIKAQINEFYMECSCDVYKGFTSDKKYDIVFATSWDTVKPAKKINAKERFYFVQDYEPYFFAMGDSYLSAESTYKEGFKTITIGRWLSYKLRKEFKVKTSYFSFCADLDTYKKIDIKKENAICAIFQPNKPRRCVNLLIEALKIVNSKNPDIKIYIYGSPVCNVDGLNATHLGIISPAELNNLYNRCKIGISMSASNPSRIPFEMMASGLPVIDLYRENNLYDLPDNCVLLSGCTPEALSSSILKLYEDDLMRKDMSDNSIKYMNEFPLQKGYEEFINSFNNLLSNNISNSTIKKIYNKSKSDISKKYIDDMYSSDNYENTFVCDEIVNSVNNALFLQQKKELESILNSKRWKIAKIISSPIDFIRRIKRK